MVMLDATPDYIKFKGQIAAGCIGSPGHTSTAEKEGSSIHTVCTYKYFPCFTMVWEQGCSSLNQSQIVATELDEMATNIRVKFIGQYAYITVVHRNRDVMGVVNEKPVHCQLVSRSCIIKKMN